MPPSTRCIFSREDAKRGRWWIREFVHCKWYRYCPISLQNRYTNIYFCVLNFLICACPTCWRTFEPFPSLFPYFHIFPPFPLSSSPNTLTSAVGEVQWNLHKVSWEHRSRHWFAEVGPESRLCGSLPNSTFSDDKLVAWSWDYFHHGSWQIVIIGACVGGEGHTLLMVVKHTLRAHLFQEKSLTWQNERKSPKPFQRS